MRTVGGPKSRQKIAESPPPTQANNNLDNKNEKLKKFKPFDSVRFTSFSFVRYVCDALPYAIGHVERLTYLIIYELSVMQCETVAAREGERERERERPSILSKQLGKNCRDKTYAQSVILESTESRGEEEVGEATKEEKKYTSSVVGLRSSYHRIRVHTVLIILLSNENISLGLGNFDT